MDLTLDLLEEEHRISGSLEYSTDLFDRSTVERMAGHLEVRQPVQQLLTLFLAVFGGRRASSACAEALCSCTHASYHCTAIQLLRRPNCKSMNMCLAAQVMLEGLTSSPQTPIDVVSLLSAGERRTVLHSFNRTLLEPPSGPYEEQTIHGMLEFWASATPASPAVEFEVSIGPMLL